MSEIRTARLMMREIREEDTEDLLAVLRDERVGRTFMLPDMSDPQTAQKLARRYCLLSQDPERFVMGISLESRLIGLVNEVDKTADTIEIGYVIHPDYWNRGYATEMMKAVIPALFARGWHTVRTGFFEENPASGRVMEKAGMHPIDLVDTVEYRGVTHRCLYYERTRKMIFYNGKIYTGELPLREAYIVEDGKFTFVGDTKDALALAGPGDELIDLEGRFVCAGFNDSHMHILNYGQALLTAKLDEHTNSLSELLAYVKDFAAEHPVAEGAWLKGRGWNQDYFTDVQRMPDRYDLDTVSTEYPICLVRCCGHCLVVNSRMLELLGITAETPQPEGGSIGIADGVPDGRFYDNAMSLVYDSFPAPSVEEVKTMIQTACKALNSYGVTSSQSDDYLTFHGLPWQTVMEAYKELEAAGELTVRVNEQSNFTDLDSLKAFTQAGHNTGTGSDMFRTGPLKMLGDGSLGARTAYLSRPYADDPSTCGFPVFSQETLDEMIGYANSIGMQVAIHAIGDGCLDMVLDAIEKALKENPREDHRHGIVHCQISRGDQLQRMIDMKLHIYAQSIFLDYDNHIVEARAGKDLASTSYSWKTLLNGGLSVSNGTDCPVEMPDALKGIQCAVTRRSVRDGFGPYLPEQAFTVQEALDSYTWRGAEASFEENKKGRIVPGQLADFVILGTDPFAADPDDIHNIEVCETWMGGVCRFRKNV